MRDKKKQGAEQNNEIDGFSFLEGTYFVLDYL